MQSKCFVHWDQIILVFHGFKTYTYYVGNSGFSLRKIGAFIKWLENCDLSSYIKTINADILIGVYGGENLCITLKKVVLTVAFDMVLGECLKQNFI